LKLVPLLRSLEATRSIFAAQKWDDRDHRGRNIRPNAFWTREMPCEMN
jgi:hypothetical protein